MVWPIFNTVIELVASDETLLREESEKDQDHYSYTLSPNYFRSPQGYTSAGLIQKAGACLFSRAVYISAGGTPNFHGTPSIVSDGPDPYQGDPACHWDHQTY